MAAVQQWMTTGRYYDSAYKFQGHATEIFNFYNYFPRVEKFCIMNSSLLFFCQSSKYLKKELSILFSCKREYKHTVNGAKLCKIFKLIRCV